MKTHWLYGRGPDKVLEFAVEVDTETSCATCIHKVVCDGDMEKRCSNFLFGNSDQPRGCLQCLHRFTRWDKDRVPCFHCKFHMAKLEAKP